MSRLDCSQIVKHLFLINILFNERKKDSCYSLPTLENSWTYFRQGLGYKVLQSLMTWFTCFWVLVTLCRMPRGLQHNSKVNSTVEIARWIINWVMWTQHNPRDPLAVIALISKGCFCQVSNYKVCILGFLYHNSSSLHVVLNRYWASALIKVTGKIKLVHKIDLVCDHL